MVTLTTNAPTLHAPAQALTSRKAALVRRLDVGWQKIEDARQRGEDVRHWEDAWLRLLAEYEAVCTLAA